MWRCVECGYSVVGGCVCTVGAVWVSTTSSPLERWCLFRVVPTLDFNLLIVLLSHVLYWLGAVFLFFFCCRWCMHDLVYLSMRWRVRCAVFSVVCSWDQLLGFRKGSLCSVQFSDSPAECEVGPSCVFQRIHVLPSKWPVLWWTVQMNWKFLLWSTVWIGTEIAFPFFLSFMVFFLHVARVLCLELMTLHPSYSICTNLANCTTHACVKTVVYHSLLQRTQRQ